MKGHPPEPDRREGPLPLIPRADFFAAPARDQAAISPDGRWIAEIAPSPAGVANIWVEASEGGARRQLTAARDRPIRAYTWARDSRRLLYFSDENGNEDYHLYATDLEGGTVRDLTPFEGVRAQSLLLAPSHPAEILVGMNRRDPRLFDMYRVDLDTGDASLDTENPGDVIGWAADPDLVIRAATAFTGTLDTVVRVRDTRQAAWRDIHVIPFEEAPFLGQVNGGSIVVGFSTDGRGIFAGTSKGSPTTRLVELDTATGAERRCLAADPRADLWQLFAQGFIVLADPRDGRPQAAAFDHFKPEWRVLDPVLREDVAYLGGLTGGVFMVTSQDLANERWTVVSLRDDAPAAHYLYRRGGEGVRREARLLFHDRPDLEKHALAAMRPVTIPARDGFELLSYLTLPTAGRKPYPLVLLVHGGPWSRDEWGFDPTTQWLANRGYAVLSVNYRGSTVNERYMNAGNGRIGTGTDEDLADAARWAIREGYADPRRVAIMGASFGGYSVLRALARHADLYACGVDIVGPSEMATLMNSIPQYWQPVRKRWLRRIGDVLADSTLNRELSPLYEAAAIRAPLLIGHGAHDPRVKLEQSERLVAEIRARGGAVTFIVYSDEGHGFARPENQMDFNGRVEEFLQASLGGRAEPWRAVAGSTAEVR